MTLKELKERADKTNIKYAYDVFKNPVAPPHLTGIIINDDNFAADNVVYYANNNFQLDLTTLKKDLKLQKLIETEILYDVYWTKQETSNKTEEVYITSYYFKIKEEN